MTKHQSDRGEEIRVISESSGDESTVIVYRCQLEWNDLKDTANPEIKHCDHCARSVYRARDTDGLLQLIAADRGIRFERPGHGQVDGLFFRT